MAEKLTVDLGQIELEINGRGTLRFNPSDFNLYRRFCDLVEELPAIEERYRAQVEDAEGEVDPVRLAGSELERARALDAELKAKLSAVFGGGQDFDKLLDGVNLMAWGKNGQRVAANLLGALTPYLEEGVQRHMQEEAGRAVAHAEARRAERRTKC